MNKLQEARQRIKSLLDSKLSPKVFAAIMIAMVILNAVMLFGHK